MFEAMEMLREGYEKRVAESTYLFLKAEAEGKNAAYLLANYDNGESDFRNALLAVGIAEESVQDCTDRGFEAGMRRFDEEATEEQEKTLSHKILNGFTD
jgi:hypothetical protein